MNSLTDDCKATMLLDEDDAAYGGLVISVVVFCSLTLGAVEENN